MADEKVSVTETSRSLDPEDWNAFRGRAHTMLDAAIDHVEGACDRPVWTPVPDSVKQALAEPIPLQGQGTDKTCEELLRRFFLILLAIPTPDSVAGSMALVPPAES